MANETQASTDADLKDVINAISGGDNVAAQKSFDQVMQLKQQDALNAWSGTKREEGQTELLKRANNNSLATMGKF